MVFSSVIFLFCFLPIFLLCYFLPKKRKTRNIVLLLFSLLFYSYGEPIYVLLMIMSIIVNYYIALLMDKSKNKKIYLVIDIIFNLGLLFLFKYFDFFINDINNVFNLNLRFLNLSLPIGISFYTFQILSYVIDLYKGKVEVQKSIINLGCYISAFPQLIAGPIVRYQTVNEELENRCENEKDIADGIKKFIIGLSKKVIIANEMAYVADTLYGSVGEIGFLGTLIASICYTLQIYFDFSGYSDMAIGLGKILGFHYLENFNYPYIAKSITDFWRRWHISLSSFFRDYVYIPLGGNRCNKLRHLFNLFVVWFLTGLWHGASWNFILWGLYFFVILIIEKYILNKFLDKIPSPLQHIYALVLINIGFIIFYFTDMANLKIALESLFGFHGFGNLQIFNHLQIFKVRTIIIFLVALVGATPYLKKFVNKNWVLIVLFIFSIISILASSYNPFIYFRF